MVGGVGKIKNTPPIGVGRVQKLFERRIENLKQR